MGRQQMLDIGIVERGEGDDGVGMTTFIRQGLQPFRFCQRVIRMSAGIDMDELFDRIADGISEIVGKGVVLGNGLDTAIGAVIGKWRGQPRIPQPVELPEVDMGVHKSLYGHVPLSPLICRPPAGGIEDRGGCEGTFFRGHEADRGGRFIDHAQSAHGNLGAHIFDLRRGQLFQDG